LIIRINIVYTQVKPGGCGGCVPAHAEDIVERATHQPAGGGGCEQRGRVARAAH